MKLISTLWCIPLLLTTFISTGQTTEKKTFYARRLMGVPPRIDGRLDEEEWKQAAWENGFFQHRPYDGKEATQKTFFTIFFDDNYLYAGLKMFDTSPDSIVKRLTRRDDTDGDIAGIEIDSYSDNRTAFAFAVTSSGVKYDFMETNDGGTTDDTWNPVWWVDVSDDSLGWYAEMKIPFTQLRFGKDQEQNWGFQVLRYLFRKEELDLWQPVSPKQPGFVSFFGRLRGINDIKPRKTTDIMPYLVAKTEQFQKEPGNRFREKGHGSGFDAGIDAKIGLTNYLTLDLTVNPDFGQVEADPSEVNLSTYETFFAEQRPFFIEGKNILSFGLNFGDGELADEGLFYSRRIGRKPQYIPESESGVYTDVPDVSHILGAAKITGKTRNGWSVGILESMTAKEKASLSGNGRNEKITVEPFTNFVAGRLQKDLHEGNTYIGGMITAVNRNAGEEHLAFLHKSAYTGGIDFVHKWKEKAWQFETSLYGSRVAGDTAAISRTQKAWTHLFQRPDAENLRFDSTRTSLAGHGGKIVIGEYGGNWKFLAAATWKSPGLELNDVGYLRETNNILQVLWTGYHKHDPFSIFNNMYLNMNQWTEWDFSGKFLSSGGNVNLSTTFRNYWSFFFSSNISGESVSMSALRGGPALKLPGNINIYSGFSSNEQKKLTIGIEGYISRGFIKSYLRSEGMELELAYRPFKTLKFSFEPEYDVSRSEMQYVIQVSSGGINRYIFASIRRHTLSTSMRISLNLTPDLSLQYWGQPFIASGKYSGFKRIKESLADEYASRFKEYDPGTISCNPSGEICMIEDNSIGTIRFDQPDFNIREFLSNMVLRWEYQPGSTLFLVWSQNRESSMPDGTFDFGRDAKALFSTKAGNIFLVKLSYRFGR